MSQDPRYTSTPLRYRTPRLPSQPRPHSSHTSRNDMRLGLITLRPPSRNGHAHHPPPSPNRATTAAQPVRYCAPYAETVSATPSVIRVTTSGTAATRSPGQSHRYQRAPPPASHRSASAAPAIPRVPSIASDSYMTDSDSFLSDAPSEYHTPPVTGQELPTQQTYDNSEHFQSSALHKQQRQRSASPDPEDFYRDPRRLLPTAVREPRSFKYTLEPARSEDSRVTKYGSSTQYPVPAQYDGAADAPSYRLRPQAGTYREISPFQLSAAYSQPTRYVDPRPPLPPTRVGHVHPGDQGNSQPFFYEHQPRSAYTKSTSSISKSPRTAVSGERPGAGGGYLGYEEEMAGRVRPSAGGMTLSPARRSSSRRMQEGGGRGSVDVVELRTPGGTTVRVVGIGNRAGGLR